MASNAENVSIWWRHHGIVDTVADEVIITISCCTCYHLSSLFVVSGHVQSYPASPLVAFSQISPLSCSTVSSLSCCPFSYISSFVHSWGNYLPLFKWCRIRYCLMFYSDSYSPFPDDKVHGANMGPTWVLSAPDGPHVGPMNHTNRVLLSYGDTLNVSSCTIVTHPVSTPFT